MSYVPDGVYFGGESEEEDGYCGFDFGDTPPSKTVTFAEPSAPNKPPAQDTSVGSSSNFGTPEHTSTPADGGNDPSPHSAHFSISPRKGGFGLPPKPTNQKSAGATAREGRKRGRRRMHSREEQDQGRRARSLEVGEEMRVAVVRGNVEEVKRILDSGFDPNTALKSGWTALMYACDCCEERVVELLLSRGASPNTQKDQFTALMAVCCSKSDREEKLVSCTRVLINKGARVNAHDRHHMSPLLYACQSGHSTLAQLLITTNADVNKQDTRGWTPLHYAATTGNMRLVQTLLGANAKVDIMCNFGETAASIAYAHGHMSVADLLENTTASTGAIPLPSSLPPHPLFGNSDSSGGALEAKLGRTSPPPPPPPSQPLTGVGECVHYGDLDLFLLGLKLGDLISLFQTHRVKFSDLLSMTDRDLEQMGVSQVGVRKRILDGILEIHKKQWDMPQNNLPYNRPISSSEAAVILSHLSLHASYIQGTASFLLTHVKSTPDMLDPNMEPSEVEKLTSELSSAVTAVSSLHGEVQALQTHMHRALGPQQQATPRSPSQFQILPKVVKAVKFTGAVMVLACTVYFTGRALTQHFNAR